MEGLNEIVEARSTTTEMMMSRQAQEVQGQIVMAKKFPRNEVISSNRIVTACKRRKLAEKAEYEYPRGGQKVTGPSIRLAEALAQNWGNIDFGYIELERRSNETQVMAYAWDLETNSRQTKVFTVPHVRETKAGNIPLTNPRDIYELVANQAARRVRSCILGIIPGDIVEEAIEQCHRTLIEGEKKPLPDLVKDMARIFQDEFSVPLESIEKYIGCKSTAFSMNDLIRLKKVYASLKDGMSKREEVFELPGVAPDGDSEIKDVLADKEEKGAKKKEKSADAADGK